MTVHPQVRTPDGHAYDVLFVGTTDGTVLKIVNTADPTNQHPMQRPTLIEEILLFNGKQHTRIEKLRVVRNSMESAPKLAVLTSDSALSVPLARCGAVDSCASCVALTDPYCAWDVRREACADLMKVPKPVKVDSTNFLQNIVEGRHADCGNAGEDVFAAAEEIFEEKDSSSVLVDFVIPATADDEDLDEEDLAGDMFDSDLIHHHHHHHADSHYSTEELSMAVATSCVCALVVGFVGGFLMARRCSCHGGGARDLQEENPYHVPYLNQ